MARLEVLAGKAGAALELEEKRELVFLCAGAAGIELATERPDDYLAALFPAGGRWVLMPCPGGRTVAVNGLPVVGLKVLDEADEVEAGGVRLRLSEEEVEVLAADHPLIAEGKLCPGCGQPFAAGQAVTYCPKTTCRMAHHAESEGHAFNCLHELARCGSNPFCGYLVPGAEGSSEAEAN